ncbi:DEAD/DEAH box helicase [Candidatus Phytoplasma meliae]|uniref:DEAD/DEAH box helicase n=1 Tax=Candidatus Phytoplasma meliae TaxID=1848402 RepID=A0ABS5CXN2_9MOLU|nr:DEAD/DEAH box helicase [Candidatus Phytoplasma meliae]MBP5835726.1 DEAD/DEAH box helicase [Candidatus Phytoplasma meliae]
MNTLFEQLPILEQTKKALKELNFIDATPIQALVIPEIIEGHDVIGQAQTGTGKTFAFGIPIIEKIDPKLAKTQSLILCPTRELTLQVYEELKKLLRFYHEIRIAVIFGGESYTKQFRALESKPHLIIATPGRIIDHLEKGKIDLSGLKILTLDEADEMLKMGFQDALETILKQIPEKRQTVLFSATLPPFIKKIASKYQKDTKILKVPVTKVAVNAIEQFYFLVKEVDKNKLLLRLLDLKKDHSVILFANTKKDVDEIASYLQDKGFLADAVHGDLKQNQRQYVMNNFRKGKIKILIATDVAARGLDISDIKIVINYDLPHAEEVYVHRIGRTGRAGKKGLAYSLISPRKMGQLKKLEYYLKEKINFLEIPSVDNIQKELLKNFEKQILEMITQNNEEKTNYPLIEGLLKQFSAEQIIQGLLKDILPKKRHYPDILAPRIGFNNSFTSKSFNEPRFHEPRYGSSKRSDFIEVIINLGKKDNINPTTLIRLLKDQFQIYGKNIGNIKHLTHETIFEVASRFWYQMKNKTNVRFQNKTLIVNKKNY